MLESRVPRPALNSSCRNFSAFFSTSTRSFSSLFTFSLSLSAAVGTDAPAVGRQTSIAATSNTAWKAVSDIHHLPSQHSQHLRGDQHVEVPALQQILRHHRHEHRADLPAGQVP